MFYTLQLYPTSSKTAGFSQLSAMSSYSQWTVIFSVFTLHSCTFCDLIYLPAIYLKCH